MRNILGEDEDLMTLVVVAVGDGDGTLIPSTPILIIHIT